MQSGSVSGVDNDQSDQFCEFLSSEWRGTRPHSYRVPNSGKSAAWSRTLDPMGRWSAKGLQDAMLKYSWNGRDYASNEDELKKHGEELRSAIKRSSNSDVCEVARDVMRWGGVDNVHRQKGTFTWIDENSQSICQKLSDAVDLIKDEKAPLDRFDGIDLIMNSAMTKIVSLSDPEERLVIYDSRVAAALGFFLAKFAEESMDGSRKISDQLRFAVAGELRRKPYTNRVRFPSLFGKGKDRCHAAMMRIASQLIAQVSKGCEASPRQIEAALFMWGYDVLGDARSRS